MANPTPSVDLLRERLVDTFQSTDFEPWRKRLALAGVVVLVVGFMVNRWLWPDVGPPPESYLPRATTTAVAPPTTSLRAAKVHVAGAVARPGVIDVPAGSRVGDATTAAGGFTADADLDRINLAAKLSDGQRVYVLRRGEQVTPPVPLGGGGNSDSHEASGPISLNSASAKELEELPGVGPATAAAIVAYRQQKGGFTTIEQLGQVKGIGPAKLAQMRPRLTL